MKFVLIILNFFCWTSLYAQEQIDFVGSLNFGIEKRLSQSIHLTGLSSIKINQDLHEVGFFFLDVGAKYKYNNKVGINFNYRYAKRRNLDNGYDTRHFLYGDLDLNHSFRKWTMFSTHRFQAMFYSHIGDSYKRPVFYLRNQFGIKYRINYFWQPYIESELFTPMFRSEQALFNQYRISFGVSYTFNRDFKISIFEQAQHDINQVSRNTNFITALTGIFRW